VTRFVNVARRASPRISRFFFQDESDLIILFDPQGTMISAERMASTLLTERETARA
jgi:hypothetical protein